MSRIRNVKNGADEGAALSGFQWTHSGETHLSVHLFVCVAADTIQRFLNHFMASLLPKHIHTHSITGA